LKYIQSEFTGIINIKMFRLLNMCRKKSQAVFLVSLTTYINTAADCVL
jgi:hypothetical protein